MCMNRYLPLLVLLPIMVSSCQSDRYYSKSFSIEKPGWAYQDSLAFTFEVVDTSDLFDLVLQIDHTDEFPFQNLYTRAHTYFPSGKKHTQLLSLELMDKVGFWQGDCSGTSCAFQVPIQENIFFQETGTYRFVLEQYSRNAILNGVQSIGLQLVQKGNRQDIQ